MIRSVPAGNGNFIVLDGHAIVGTIRQQGCEPRIERGYAIRDLNNWTGRYVVHSLDDGEIGTVGTSAEGLVMIGRMLGY